MDTYQTQPSIEQPRGGNGGSLAIIIVILIIALGGVYFWYSRTASNTKQMTSQSITNENLSKDLQSSAELDITADLSSIDSDFK